jgi:hypothetical protein
MNQPFLRQLAQTDFEKLLDSLTKRQFLHPHEPLANSLAATVQCVGVCPISIERAIGWLAIDPTLSIGRLRRTELTQLARSIHRFWRQRPADVPQPSRQV